MMNKLVHSIREAIQLSGLKSGMSISFHHHLRNGDYTLNMVMREIADLGIRDLTLNASSLFDCHAELAEHIKNHVVRRINCNYMSAGLGHMISEGLMEECADRCGVHRRAHRRSRGQFNRQNGAFRLRIAGLRLPRCAVRR